LVHFFAGPLKSLPCEEIIKAFRDLVKEYTPTAPAPGKNQSARFLEWRDHIGTEKKSGVIRLTFHHQRNHSRQNPPNPSSDFVSKSGKKMMAGAEFRKSRAMINVADTISIMFTAVDPYTWRKYRNVYVRMASEFRLVEECDPNRIQCFVGHYMVFFQSQHSQAESRWIIFQKQEKVPCVVGMSPVVLNALLVTNE
jgi:hypothetical protein